MDNFKSYLAESADAALKKKADKSGFSLSILKQVYKRGVAAWKVGHKPGTTPQQWGMARVNSFITGGRTRVKGDPDLWAKQKGKIRKPKKVEEEAEQIDEISTDMKNRYMNRASQAAVSATMAGKYTKGKEKEKFDRIAKNRKAGIKKIVGEEDVSERTLTPAEKKKREEIAKAMERDNPGMDMGKKMAIATATAKKVAEEKDPNEYDREGEMMKGQLRQICSANEKLMKMVGDNDNLPEWVQNKVTKATDYIRSVRDYLESENGKDDMSEAKVDEISLDMLTKKVSNTNMGNVRKAMKTDKVKTDLAMMKKKLDNHKGMKPIKAQTEDVQSADKKPEKYVKPDGKVGIRMVRTDKQVVKKDA